jgi:FAD/FMN-containing dehydrogenase
MSAIAERKPRTAQPSRYNIAALKAELSDIQLIDEPQVVRKRSRDFFWYSPVLNVELADKSADIIACPRDEAEIVRIASACAKLRIPLTVRAAGTGNYGQAVPLQGGVLLDINALTGIAWQTPGIVRAASGSRLLDIDMATQQSGFELRMHPSTKRSATLGGFVAGGSGGVGSVTYGGLREPGNILAARIVTVEEEPRILELRDDAAQKVNRAYGTTGIITALEMPLSPAWPWIDVIVAFDDYMDAFRAGYEVALADGVVKKLVTPVSWPIPGCFGALKQHCPAGKSILICMIAEASLGPFKAIIGQRGAVTYEAPSEEGPGKFPLYEYTWNHTTLQWLKSDRSVTYLQCLFPHDRLVESAQAMISAFPDEVLAHHEFIRFGGRVTASALPILRYTTRERLDEVIALHEEAGVMIANPHVVSLEAGSRHKRADADQLGFKREVDPYGLLNPGKMASFKPSVAAQAK